MHPYQIDEVIRTRIFIISAALSIGSAWLFNFFTTALKFSVPWWIETPSVLGFFGLYVWLYNNWFWKKWPFRKLSWFYIPDLSGKWNVTIKSSFKNFEEETLAWAMIRQTASKMSISLDMPQSKSYSAFAIISRIERQNTFEMIYHYENHPKPDSKETMSIHKGTTWVQIADDIQTMNGDYYSGRGRQHFGSILFVRKRE